MAKRTISASKPSKTKSKAAPQGKAAAKKGTRSAPPAKPSPALPPPGPDDTQELQVAVNRDERASKIKEMIKLSQEQGFLTYDDINEIMPESAVNSDEFDGILILLKGMKMEVVESAEENALREQER